MANLNYSVLAGGDTNYENFCGFGKSVDQRLGELGAKRIFERVYCNVDFEEGAARWQNGVFEALKKIAPPGDAPQLNGSGSTNGTSAAPSTPVAEKTAELRAQEPVSCPFAHQTETYRGQFEKDTRYYEICLRGSGLTYELAPVCSRDHVGKFTGPRGRKS